MATIPSCSFLFWGCNAMQHVRVPVVCTPISGNACGQSVNNASDWWYCFRVGWAGGTGLQVVGLLLRVLPCLSCWYVFRVGLG